MLKDKNSHERDSRIVFEEENHQYYVDGKDDYISVTTLIKSFFAKFDSDLIISKMQNSKNWPQSVYFGMTKEEIQQQWEDKKNKASTLGTLLHNTIEDFYNQKPDLQISPLIQDGFDQFTEFHKELTSTTSLVAYRTEWCVFYEKYHIAGSIDMSFVDPETGDIHLYDWKRTPGLKKENRFQKGLFPISHLQDCNFSHYSLQLNIYKFILESMYGKKVKGMTLVCLHPDNETFIKEPVGDLQNEVLSLLKYGIQHKLYEKK